jgi:diguanylate cyclase (GGDEF)-like protein
MAADQRDRAADERDRAADERDQAADDRDQAGDKSVVPVTERITVSALSRADGARKQAASDRRQARQDRRSGARERVSAERDRHTAMADREAGADERSLASVDRETALTDRGAGASERTDAGRDRATASDDREVSAHEREYASIDGLTGVFNRGAGLEMLQRDMARAKRTGEPLVLAFLDVDQLKAVNDAGGHAAGDRMLTEVAQTVKAALRPYDLIIRYGGDEFICAIAGLDMPEVTERFAVVDAALTQAREHGSITAGMASLQPDDSAGDLISRADQALYLRRQQRGGGKSSLQ